jgi:glycosyltransferase involved in cell wall biosynthesis
MSECRFLGILQAMRTLSIVIPFYRDDPSPLLGDLAGCVPDGIEIILRDDGTGDRDLSHAVATAMRPFGEQARLSTAPANEGRSRARNALIALAEAPTILFLDADMRLPDQGFIRKWMTALEVHPGKILFGGFETSTPLQTTSLHAAMAARSDCPSADKRNKAPARYVYTSNLAVPRAVLDKVRFATDFVGWGWEDVEWAIRASAAAPIHHIDNPAIHIDCLDDDALLARFATSADNFALLVRKHPAIARTMPAYRAAKLFCTAPPPQALTSVFADLARHHALPISLRVIAAKLWRASHYARALRP